MFKLNVGAVFRIITPQATRAIFPLFKQELTGPYTTWSQYKKQGNNLTRVYERWQECNFKFTCSEKDIKNAFEKHIENRYPDWMSAIRNSIFKKHKTAAARYANCPKGIKRNVWPQLVEEWLKPEWQVTKCTSFLLV